MVLPSEGCVSLASPGDRPINDGWGACDNDPKLIALMNGNAAEAKALLNKPCDLLYWLVGFDSPDLTTVHIAFQTGVVDIVRHLAHLSPKHFMQILTVGSGEGWPTYGFTTPLKEALLHNRHDLVSWMCETGVMTDIVFEQCKYGSGSPLQSALEIVAERDLEEQRRAEWKTKEYTWTSEGIDQLVEGGELREPGKAKHKPDTVMREGEVNCCMFEGAVVGAPVTGEQKDFIQHCYFSLKEIFKGIVEVSAEFKPKPKSKMMRILEEWKELPDAERKGRTEAFFADLIWPVKRVVSVHMRSPTEVSCTDVGGDSIATVEVSPQDHAPELIDKVAKALGESKHALSIVLSSGTLLSMCEAAEPLSNILS